MSYNGYEGAMALRRAAGYAQKAGKKRTYEWLIACAFIFEREGPDAAWPDAPAYKGPVVLVGDPGPGLKALTADQLTALGVALDAERFDREHD